MLLKRLLLFVLCLGSYLPIILAFDGNPGWMLAPQSHSVHVPPPSFTYRFETHPAVTMVSRMPVSRVMQDVYQMRVDLSQTIELRPGYIQNEFQKHVIDVVNKPCTVVKAVSDVLANRLNEAHYNLDVILEKRRNFISSHGFPSTTMSLTKEDVRRLPFQSQAQYYAIERHRCDIESTMALHSKCLEYNAGLVRSFDWQLKSAEKAFQKKETGIQSCELLEKEVKTLNELISKEQRLVNYQEQAAVAQQKIDTFSLRDKVRNFFQYDLLKHRVQEATKQAERIEKEVGFKVSQEMLAQHQEQVCHLVDVITYNQQCAQIQGLYTRLDAKGALDSDDKQLLEAVNKTVEGNFVRTQVTHELTRAGEEILKARMVSVEPFKIVVCDPFQKTLSVRVCNTINQVGAICAGTSDPSVRAYALPTIDSCISTQHIIFEGAPYEAVVWAKFVQAMDELTHIAVERAKDDPSLCSKINGDVLAVAHKIEEVISLADWCQKKILVIGLLLLKVCVKNLYRCRQTGRKRSFLT